MDSGRAPVAVAFLALVGACVAAFVIGTPARSLRGAPAADAFFTTWRESRMATYVVDSDFTRTLPDGAVFEQDTSTRQRPPNDRLVIGFGTAAGRVRGKVYRCAGAVGAAPRCTTSVDAAEYGKEVDAEIAVLEAYLTGFRPAYGVIEFSGGSDSQCFRLDLLVNVPSPPYGEHALFCFDRVNRAPVLTVIQRVEATDRTQARSVRTEVTDQDFTEPTDLGQVIAIPGPTTTSTSTTAPGG